MRELQHVHNRPPEATKHRAAAFGASDIALKKETALSPGNNYLTNFHPAAVIQKKPGEDEELPIHRMPINNQNGTLQTLRFVQSKLSINQPGDIYEQEADAMADKVMRMKDPLAANRSYIGNAFTPVQRKCAACEKDETHVHRKESAAGEMQAGDDLGNYVSSLGSSGQALPESNRQFFEPRFGHDFSNVRIHTGSVAAKSAQSINALAYTTGNNIVFNSGQYAPGTETGQRLLAHELTHVVQQGTMQTARAKRLGESSISRYISQPAIQRALPVAAEVLEIALTATIVVQEQAAISQGGLRVKREQGQRMGDPPQPKDNDYKAHIFEAYRNAHALPQIFANFYIEWEGNKFGEMAGAHITVGPDHPEFSSSELDVEFTPLTSLGRKGLDKRAWPMVWTYSGNFNPAGPGNWDFQGKFEINAFGGFKILEHVVTDHSLYGGSNAESFVSRGVDIDVPIPPAPQKK